MVPGCRCSHCPSTRSAANPVQCTIPRHPSTLVNLSPQCSRRSSCARILERRRRRCRFPCRPTRSRASRSGTQSRGQGPCCRRGRRGGQTLAIGQFHSQQCEAANAVQLAGHMKREPLVSSMSTCVGGACDAAMQWEGRACWGPHMPSFGALVSPGQACPVAELVTRVARRAEAGHAVLVGCR